MNWDAVAAFAESLAAIGVFFSLIYVGYQVKETRKAVKAATAQARTDLGVQLITSRYTSNIAEVLTKSQIKPAELTEAEQFKLKSFFSAHVRHAQNMYYQQKEGLLDDYFRYGVSRVVAYWVRNYDWALNEWTRVRETVPPDFSAFIDDELRKHPERYAA
jgi:hypothetical protein